MYKTIAAIFAAASMVLLGYSAWLIFNNANPSPIVFCLAAALVLTAISFTHDKA